MTTTTQTWQTTDGFEEGASYSDETELVSLQFHATPSKFMGRMDAIELADAIYAVTETPRLIGRETNAVIKRLTVVNEQLYALVGQLQADATSALLLRRVVAAIDEVDLSFEARARKVMEIVERERRPSSTMESGA